MCGSHTYKLLILTICYNLANVFQTVGPDKSVGREINIMGRDKKKERKNMQVRAKCKIYTTLSVEQH